MKTHIPLSKYFNNVKKQYYCYICNNNICEKNKYICTECVQKYSLTRLNTAGIRIKFIILKKYDKTDVCLKCGKKINYTNFTLNKRNIFYCKECETKFSHTVKPCVFLYDGCKNKIAKSYKFICDECKMMLHQKYCPTCGSLLAPPSNKHLFINNKFYCSKECIKEVPVLKSKVKKQSGYSKQDNNLSIKIIKSKCINSIPLNFVLKKIDLLGNKLTTGDIVDIAEDYANYRRDDFIDEGREQVKHETSLEIDKLYKEQTRILYLTTKFNFCLRSGNVPNSNHHVIPRKFKEDYIGTVIDSLRNRLYLEKKAHDDIEIGTCNFIKERLEQNRKPTIEDLIYKIYFGFSGEDFKEINDKRIEGIVQTLMLQGFSQKDASAYAPVINNMLADKVEKYSKNKRNTKWFMIF